MKTIQIDLTPEEYFTEELLKKAVAKELHTASESIAHVEVVKRSLDSRRGIRYHATAEVYMAGEPIAEKDYSSPYQDCRNGDPVVIVGAGPAGLFAALKALEKGLKPIIIERGKPVKERKLDIAQLAREKQVNPESNWCFGEGGAGTFSDGKLYTRSNKRGNIDEVISKFVEHGADPKIMIDAHAHIGTDCLSGIIANMRNTITNHGGEYHFESRVVDLIIDGDSRVRGVIDHLGNRYEGLAVILATGHSARDIYELFYQKGWQIEAKPFAMGVRVEHPQRLINSIQYHTEHYSPLLPPASYSLVTQVGRHGVFSFCMCPGGVIVPAATADGQQVVNGMSNSNRNSPYANSGIAVTVGLEDVPQYSQYGELALLRFQQDVERRVFEAAGNSIKAPSQRLTDFVKGKPSTRLNKSNYMGECVSANVYEILPDFVVEGLQQGFMDFGRKMRGFYTAEASVLAVESRTSSPVRIPRDRETLEHPQLKGLYPCGEGAGYAGGIVSSAMDGINCIEKFCQR